MKACMAKTMAETLYLSLFAWIYLILSLLTLPAKVEAAPSISAGYIQDSGSQLVIEIRAGSTPPASVILIQYLPPGVRMLSSHPEASNYNAKGNRAKWLLRDLRPGISTVSMTLDRSVNAGDVSAEIRYVPKAGARMTTFQVAR